MATNESANLHQPKYLERGEIDPVKWDACISSASNSLIYAHSFYLDHMAIQWSGLVMDDYLSVMPLTWNKKYGFYYLYQPFLCASLGVFGKELTADIVNAFLLTIPHRFKYWDIFLNHGNLFPLKNFQWYERLDHLLPLNQPMEQLYKNYRTSYKQLLARFSKMGGRVMKDIPVREVLALAQDKMNPIFKIDESDYDRFASLYEYLYAQDHAVNYGVYGPNGDLLASGIFLIYEGRAYYILAGNHPNGRTLGASHQVLHSFISDYAGTNLILDFEGSVVSQIAFFFKGFGAQEQKYPGILYNRLPPLLRWLKPVSK